MSIPESNKTLIYAIIGLSVVSVIAIGIAFALWWGGGSVAPVATVGVAAAAAAAEATRQRLEAIDAVDAAAAEAARVEHEVKARQATLDALSATVREKVVKTSDEDLTKLAKELFKPGDT